MSIFENKWAATGVATVLGVGFIALGTIAASATGLLPAAPEATPVVTLSPVSDSTLTVDDDEVDCEGEINVAPPTLGRHNDWVLCLEATELADDDEED